MRNWIQIHGIHVKSGAWSHAPVTLGHTEARGSLGLSGCMRTLANGAPLLALGHRHIHNSTYLEVDKAPKIGVAS